MPLILAGLREQVQGLKQQLSQAQMAVNSKPFSRIPRTKCAEETAPFV